MRITVCQNCTEREIGCHSFCEKYIAEKKEFDSEKSVYLTEKEKERILGERVKSGIKNMQTKSRNNGRNRK